MPESFPTFKKLVSVIKDSNYDKYSFFLCVFGFCATAIMLAQASSYFTIESIWILSPFVFFGFITLIFDPKDQTIRISWKMAITLWLILDGVVKVQITYFPGSSTDGIAWLFLPVYSMIIVFLAFGISYTIFYVRNKLKSDSKQ